MEYPYGISNEQLKEFDFLKYYLSKYSRTPREYIRTVNSCFSKVLCESILNEKINLYSDQNYRFRNIIGLNRYCIKNNKVNELKIYYEKNINSLNVMRFLGDCLQMGYSLIGNDKSYIYSINLEYILFVH